jgi:hypothetical protein
MHARARHADKNVNPIVSAVPSKAMVHTTGSTPFSDAPSRWRRVS